MHTEGPWQSQHDFDMEGVCRIIGAIDGPDDGRFHYRVVCEIDPDGSLDAKEQYANARLIAAAPELYEALSGILAMVEDMAAIFPIKLDDEGLSAMDRARAALAKAGTPQADQSNAPCLSG